MTDATTTPAYPTNRYLQGSYTPVTEERTVAFEAMTVLGELPDDLDGVYARNGPNPRYAPPGNYHRYDGDGMVHAVHFGDGRATYRNRWIRTACLEEEDAAGRALWGGMLDPRRADRPDMPLKDTANTDLVMHAGRLVAMWYMSGVPYLMDPVTLETLGPATPEGAGPWTISAHSKTDESSGEFVFFGYGREAPYMVQGVLDHQGRLLHQTPVDLPGPRMPHDMWVSRRHTIVHDLPLIWDEEAYAKGRVKLRFEETWPTRFGVIPRHGAADEMRWYEFAPCYLLHTINAWEEGDWLHLAGCRIEPFRDAQGNPDLQSIVTIMGRHRLNARLYRWSINLATGQCKEGPLDDRWNAEFPTWNNAAMGTAMRHAYCAEIATEPTVHFPGLLRFDLETGQSEHYAEGPGHTYSEAVFAPARDAAGQDDGYVVSFVRNEAEARSEVHIFAAQDFAAGPVCKLILPCRVPDGFHATWARGDLLARVG